MPNLVILTGAGISAESGLSTFRAENGLWCSHRVEDVATPEGFARNPTLVQEFYNQRRRQLKEVQPNPAHLALAKLEKEWQGEFLLVTQNVDDLHERAGSGRKKNNSGQPSFVHMHGELKKVRCLNTGRIYAWEEDIKPTSLCLCCREAESLRPHIVWFGEMPLMMPEIYRALSKADMFVSIGTSGAVYPAAGFVQEARGSGAHTVELNLEPSEGYSYFHEKHYGPAANLVPEFVEKLLGEVTAP